MQRLTIWIGLLAAASVMAQEGDRWHTVQAVEIGDEPWISGLTAVEAPPRDGEPTGALLWKVDTQRAPTSQPLFRDWSGVESVRFWLHLDRAYDFKLNLVLTGPPSGYYMATVPLDFAGWRQFTIPVERFGRVREASWEQVTSFGLRAQGYGQPEIPAGTVWYLDQLEVRLKPGAAVPVVLGGIEVTRSEWERLAEGGNPFWALGNQNYRRELPPFQPPASISSAWTWRGTAEKLLEVAWAAAGAESEHRGRADLVQHVIDGVDYLVAQLQPEGWWWRKRPPEGDPNTNRFILGPLLDAIWYLRQLPAGAEAWPRWAAPLDTAIELQKRAYRLEEDWDWGGKAAGEYANQDAYYVLIMALSALLYDRPADQALAADMTARIADNLLPDGGIRYIGIENEAPVYHSLNLIILARYATLTDDPAARKLLADTVNYYPLVCTAEGQPEYWSDVWWKQTWGYLGEHGQVIAAGATGDPRNQWLMWRVLERRAPSSLGKGGVYAAPYWPGNAPGEPMPAEFLVPDQNMLGHRGRAGNWYYGVCLGRGLRNTFTGAVLTHPTHRTPLQASFRGAQIEVRTEAGRRGLWLSQIEDQSAQATAGDAAALGVRYRLQPSRINGVPTPETPDTPWQVTQVWRAAANGSIGLVQVALTEAQTAAEIEGRIACGPQPVMAAGEGLWQSGPLQVKVYESFGEVGPGITRGYVSGEWPSVVMRQPLDGPLAAGSTWRYVVWVGPAEAAPPASVTPLADGLGWQARWADGSTATVAYNPTVAALRLTAPSGDPMVVPAGELVMR